MCSFAHPDVIELAQANDILFGHENRDFQGEVIHKWASLLGLKKDHYKGRVGQKYVLKCPSRCQRAGSDQIGDMLSSESQI